MEAFLSALFFDAGFNTTLVGIGAAFLGAAAGSIGAFVLLRRRSLVSDAISHATLPGLVFAFMLMAALTGDGRWLPGLLVGAAASAGIGLLIVEWLGRRTRLAEDAAIGIVLSVFFGLGVVLLTVVQSLDVGGQAGLEGFILGSTASMLRSEAETIAVAAGITALAIFTLRRPFTLVCFDREHAAASGMNVRAVDLALMMLTLVVTVIGLRMAGLVLIVALTIIPPVAARFWTDRVGIMVGISALFGALAAHLGAAISASGPSLPTGSLIVLSAFFIFIVSLVFSPLRGLVARRAGQRKLRRRMLLEQGLDSLAQGRPIYDEGTRRALLRAGRTQAR